MPSLYYRDYFTRLRRNRRRLATAENETPQSTTMSGYQPEIQPCVYAAP